VRKRTEDRFAPFVEYVSARLAEDPHLWGITLFDELLALGFTASYQTLTRQIRTRQLRPSVPIAAGRRTGERGHPASGR
jgi:hypothetical protein